MTKYERVKKELEETGVSQMKCFGNSMTPILKSGSKLTFQKMESYEKGDIVFCRVRGNYIDAHQITRVSQRGYLISNNHGHDNGWTKKIYGKVIKSERNGQVKNFN